MRNGGMMLAGGVLFGNEDPEQADSLKGFQEAHPEHYPSASHWHDS